MLLLREGTLYKLQRNILTKTHLRNFNLFQIKLALFFKTFLKAFIQKLFLQQLLQYYQFLISEYIQTYQNFQPNMEVKPLKTSNTLFKSFLKIFIFPGKFLQGVANENCNFVVEVHLNIWKLFVSKFSNYPMHCALFQNKLLILCIFQILHFHSVQKIIWLVS